MAKTNKRARIDTKAAAPTTTKSSKSVAAVSKQISKPNSKAAAKNAVADEDSDDTDAGEDCAEEDNDGDASEPENSDYEDEQNDSACEESEDESMDEDEEDKEDESDHTKAEKEDAAADADGEKSAKIVEAAGTKRDRKAARASQNELRTQRRNAKNSIYDMTTELKLKWEQLRMAKTEASKRSALLAEMMFAIKGRIAELAFKHDMSRVLQTMIKYASSEQRETLFTELRGQIVPLCKTNYGKHIVLKLLKDGKALRPKIIREFHTHVHKTVRHLTASQVIETIYADYARPREKYELLQELYLAEFATFKTKMPLSQIAASRNPVAIKERLLEVITPVIAKGILGDLTIVQQAALDYLSLATEEEQRELLDSVHVVAILHTREGAKLSMRSVVLAAAAARRKIVKECKSYFLKIAREEYGHQVLIQMLDTIDDTKMLAQQVLKELDFDMLGADCPGQASCDHAQSDSKANKESKADNASKPVKQNKASEEDSQEATESSKTSLQTSAARSSLKEMAEASASASAATLAAQAASGAPYFRRVAHFILSGRGSKYVPQTTITVLEQRGKKDADKRQEEILEASGQALFNAVLKNLGSWMSFVHTAPLVVETLLSVPESVDRAPAVEELARLLRESIGAGDRDRTLLRTARNLVRSVSNDSKETEVRKNARAYYATALCNALGPDVLADLGCNEGAFVALALAETPASATAAQKALRPHLSKIKKSVNPGADLLVSLLTGAKKASVAN